MLEEAKIQYCRLDGTMSRDDRAIAMEDLKKKKKIEVMLVSTRAGGVGLNLTAACRVYLVDPYWCAYCRAGGRLSSWTGTPPSNLKQSIVFIVWASSGP